FYVKENYDRMVKLKEKVNEASSIVIVGGGLAGVEIANELVEAGYKVTIVESLKHILMLNFDEDFAIKVENYLKDKGVEIVTNVSIASFEGNGKLERVTLSNGERIEADVAIITTGIVANVELAEKSGLQTTHYGVKVDPFMLTNDPRIYAVGDCAEKRDFVTKKPAKYMLASIATMEARVATVNIAKGNIVKIEGIVPKYVSKIGDIVIGAAGLTENQAKENKLGYTALSMKVKDRYPSGIVETHDLEVKLLFMKGRRYLIGGQVLGHTDYVGSLVNTIGSLIENYATAEDIIASSKVAHPLVTPSPIAEPLENIALNFLK
ncbi:MAG: FAD-dependent oxidoreductase, partial [Thermoprotei archaeon]|nr:FAD-dependent oxidoreductase [Thermoprotei archaeon]